MSILGSSLGGMNEASEPKASITLEGNQLGLLGLVNPQIGQCIEVCAEICIEAITAYKDEKGNPYPRVTFTVESIQRDADADENRDPLETIRAMYPAMQAMKQ